MGTLHKRRATKKKGRSPRPGGARAARLAYRYGITIEQWDEMYRMQEGRCPICLGTIRRPGSPDGRIAASVDHDHKTGRVRGLLCYVCNKFKVGRNTAETAARMAAYLASEFDGRLI